MSKKDDGEKKLGSFQELKKKGVIPDSSRKKEEEEKKKKKKTEGEKENEGESKKSSEKSQKKRRKDSTNGFDIWKYKPYILVGLVVLVLLVVYFFIFKNLDQFTSDVPPASRVSPTPSATVPESEMGNLEVVSTDKFWTVQLLGDTKRVPARFEKIPRGQYILILHHSQKRALEKNVKIEAGKTVTIDIDKEFDTEDKNE